MTTTGLIIIVGLLLAASSLSLEVHVYIQAHQAAVRLIMTLNVYIKVH